MNHEIAVFCGLDVGKSGHHATALDRDGGRLYALVKFVRQFRS